MGVFAYGQSDPRGVGIADCGLGGRNGWLRLRFGAGGGNRGAESFRERRPHPAFGKRLRRHLPFDGQGVQTFRDYVLAGGHHESGSLCSGLHAADESHPDRESGEPAPDGHGHRGDGENRPCARRDGHRGQYFHDAVSAASPRSRCGRRAAQRDEISRRPQRSRGGACRRKRRGSCRAARFHPEFHGRRAGALRFVPLDSRHPHPRRPHGQAHGQRGEDRPPPCRASRRQEGLLSGARNGAGA